MSWVITCSPTPISTMRCEHLSLSCSCCRSSTRRECGKSLPWHLHQSSGRFSLKFPFARGELMMCVQKSFNHKNFSNSSGKCCQFKDSRISQSDEQFRVWPHADVRFAAYNASLLGTDTCSVTWTVAARNYSRKLHHRYDGTDVGSTSSENLSRRRRITVSWTACTHIESVIECVNDPFF